MDERAEYASIPGHAEGLFGRIAKLDEALHNAIGLLESKLHPVLTPLGPEKPLDTVQPEASPIAYTLNSIEIAVNKIVDLNRRIEI